MRKLALVDITTSKLSDENTKKAKYILSTYKFSDKSTEEEIRILLQPSTSEQQDIKKLQNYFERMIILYKAYLQRYENKHKEQPQFMAALWNGGPSAIVLSADKKSQVLNQKTTAFPYSEDVMKIWNSIYKQIGKL
jgi:hypothetical protein